MEKKYQVFISSTYTDLLEERQHVVEAVLNAGHIPAGMELFKAGKAQEEIISEWIQESDIYILILGARYGSLKDGEISYTEWEYSFAKDLGKPMFSIVLSDDYINEMSKNHRINPTEIEMSNEKYRLFKQKVMNSLVCQIKNISEIRGYVYESIKEIEKKFGDNLEGWVKGNHLVELNKLKEENKNLLDKLVISQEKVIENDDKSIFKDDYIGEYKYDYVKQSLTEKFFDIEKLNLTIEEEKRNFTKQRSQALIIDRLVEFKQGNLSALNYFLDLKDELLSRGILLHSQADDRIFNDEIVSIWYQFSLIERETIIPQYNSGGFAVNKYEKITMSANGSKFMSMLQAKW